MIDVICILYLCFKFSFFNVYFVYKEFVGILKFERCKLWDNKCFLYLGCF